MRPSTDVLAMGVAATAMAVAFFCWARFVLFWRDRGPHPLRRHPGARPSMFDKWLGLK